MFLLIRKRKLWKVKVSHAKVSKMMMKYHVTIGITAAFLVIMHTSIMIAAQLEELWNIKNNTGFFALFILAVLLFSGILRNLLNWEEDFIIEWLLCFLYLTDACFCLITKFIIKNPKENPRQCSQGYHYTVNLYIGSGWIAWKISPVGWKPTFS